MSSIPSISTQGLHHYPTMEGQSLVSKQHALNFNPQRHTSFMGSFFNPMQPIINQVVFAAVNAVTQVISQLFGLRLGSRPPCHHGAQQSGNANNQMPSWLQNIGGSISGALGNTGGLGGLLSTGISKVGGWLGGLAGKAASWLGKLF